MRAFNLANARYAHVITVAARGVAIVLVVLVIIGATDLSVLRARGDQLLSVQTGSMTPTLRPGDAVIVRPTTDHDLHVGEIISYQSPHDPTLVITHRLARIDPTTKWLTTTGDALHSADPTFPPRLVVGQVTAVAPKLGLLLNALRHPIGLAIIIYFPAAIIIIAELSRLANHYDCQQYTLFRRRQ